MTISTPLGGDRREWAREEVEKIIVEEGGYESSGRRFPELGIHHRGGTYGCLGERGEDEVEWIAAVLGGALGHEVPTVDEPEAPAAATWTRGSTDPMKQKLGAIVTGPLALAALAGAAWCGYQVYVEQKPRLLYRQAEATILATRVSLSVDGDRVTYRPEVDFEFEVAGEGRVVKATGYDYWRAPYSDPERPKAAMAHHRIEPGARRSCWYDPSDPSKAVLFQGDTATSMLVLLLATALGTAFILGRAAMKSVAGSPAATRGRVIP